MLNRESHNGEKLPGSAALPASVVSQQAVRQITEGKDGELPTSGLTRR